ncbi:MAG: hypothetical protein M1450_00145 [Patescibacteria group bacterium]|nr:hypothetical protein [Patescibacteria group bacterium]
MISTEARVGIFCNPTARPEYLKQASLLHEKIPGSRIVELKFPLNPEQNLVPGLKVAVFVGGDGTALLGAIQCAQSEEDVVALLTKAGSACGSYIAEHNIGNVVKTKELVSGEIPDLNPIRLGEINGHLFLTAGALGHTPLEFVLERERRRKPRSSRLLATIYSGVKAAISNGSSDEIRLAFIGSYLGPIKVLREQRLDSHKVTLVTINGDGKYKIAGKLIMLLALKASGLPVHKTIAAIEQKESHEFENRNYDTVVVDGERAPLDPCGTIFVGRSDKSVRAGALVMNGR